MFIKVYLLNLVHLSSSLIGIRDPGFLPLHPVLSQFLFANTFVWFLKISTPHTPWQGRSLKIPRGGGGGGGAELKFPGGWGQGVWIFSETTHWWLKLLSSPLGWLIMMVLLVLKDSDSGKREGEQNSYCKTKWKKQVVNLQDRKSVV